MNPHPCLSLLLLFNLSLGGMPLQSGSSALLGGWNCQLLGEPVSLVFQSESILIFDGEAANYSLLPGVIVVQDGYEAVAYAYQLEGNTLQIDFPEGFQASCTRVRQPASSSRAPAGNPPPENRREAPKPADTPPQVSTASGGSATGNQVSDPSWGFEFTAPRGWKWKADHSGAVLGHDTVPGMILVTPHREASQQGLTSQMRAGLSEEGVSLRLEGELRPLANNLQAGEYSGLFQGQQVRALGIGGLSPYGGGVYVVGVTTPDKYGEGVAEAAERLAGSLRYMRSDVAELVRHFSGMWAHYSGGSGGGTLLNYEFYPDGTFSDASETSYSTEYSSDGWSMPDTSLGATGVSRSRARWTVRGSLQSGQILISRPDGSEQEIDYHVFVEKGRTYSQEYVFNGRHFSKRKDY